MFILNNMIDRIRSCYSALFAKVLNLARLEKGGVGLRLTNYWCANGSQFKSSFLDFTLSFEKMLLT